MLYHKKKKIRSVDEETLVVFSMFCHSMDAHSYPGYIKFMLVSGARLQRYDCFCGYFMIKCLFRYVSVAAQIPTAFHIHLIFSHLKSAL
jgi:hypothetical protein